MASPRFAWGIDIGNRALKAVRLVREGDTVRVDDFEFIEHDTVLSQAGDNRESLIQTALATFVQRHQIKGGVFAVGVSGQSSFARFIKLPPVEPKKIPEIVRFEAIQQIPFPLDDVEWSYQLFEQPDSPEVEVGIFAMRRELVNHHLKYFTDVDLNVQLVQTSPLAVYNAIQHDGRLAKGTAMIIDVGAENTDLIIADDRSIWLRSIPIGGNNFTETLVKAFKLPFTKAEELKRDAATSKYAKQIFQAMRPVFADLVSELQRSIGFYASVHRESRIRKIIALGGTFRLPGLQKYLQQNLQLDLDRVDSFAAGAPSDPKTAASFQENLLSAVGAYGLALQAMDQTVVTSSLLPAAIKKEKVWKEKTKWFALAAGLMVAGAAVPAARLMIDKMAFDQNASLRSETQRIVQSAQTLQQEWSAISGSGGSEIQQILNIETLVDGKLLWATILGDLGKALPQPQPAVLEGLQKADKDLVQQVDRAARRLVTLDSLSSRYDPNIAATVISPNFDAIVASNQPLTSNQPATPAWGGGGGMPMFDEFGGVMPGGDFEFNGGTGGTAETPALEGEPNPLAPAGSRGFLVTLRVTTPNRGALDPDGLVRAELVRALEAIRPNAERPNMRYAVARVSILDTQQISQNPQRLQDLARRYENARRLLDPQTQPQTGFQPAPGFNPAGGGEFFDEFSQPGGMPTNPWGGGGGTPNPWGGGGGANPWGGGQPAGGEVDRNAEAYKDRITGESVLDDWEIVIGLAIVIDPPAWTAPEAPVDEVAADQ